MGIKSDLVAKRNELAAVNEKVKKAREESAVSGGDFDLMKSTVLTGATLQDRIGEMRNLKTKQDALGKEVDDLVEALKSFDTHEADPDDTKGRMQHGEPQNQLIKSLGERFVDSKEFKAFAAGGEESKNLKLHFKELGLKTLMQTGAGFASQAIRTGEVEMYPSEPVGLFALIPKGQTSQSSYVYMEETTRTQAAAEKAETAAYAESAFAFTERTATVEDIGHWLPITRKQLDDVPQVQGIVDSELRAGLLERLDYQLFNGDGSTPNLQGLIAKTGINTQDAAGQMPLDALYMGMVKCQKNGFAEPNIVAINGENWEPIQLMKTDNGQYIWGHPADIGPMRVWGRRLVSTFRIAKGTAVLGDFSRMLYAERAGVTVEISDSHDTYFIYNKLAIRCWTRGVLVWKRPLAFCKVTNIA